MNFNPHYELVGKHAFLGASKFHWINYDEKKISESYKNSLAVERGTRLHEFAAECIRLNQRLPDINKTLNLYVNDAIGFHMSPEVILYFSPNCFGTADSIRIDKNKLRIHDFKSGNIPGHIEQLYIYDALFCLEYGIKPGDLEIENRIYQYDDYIVDTPNSKIILPIMKKIERFDKIINSIKERDG